MNAYTVRQVNSYIKQIFEQDFILKNICVKGEISNCKYHYTGHIYFSLKDESGVLQCVMFRSNAQSLKFKLQDGQHVVVAGNVSTYERDGKYQLYARTVENLGEGELYRQYEELKNRLSEMGMFDDLYKKPIPAYSMKIGVVTAETGAVIRDIYNVTSRRNPYAQIYLCPAKVQGEGAEDTICRGIRTLDKMGLDVIIAGRGGGSIEDLWAFNTEPVARCIFECNTPIISAVGHETDFTIADFVADLRAPTPSAAAELAVFDYNQFLNDMDSFRYTFENALSYKLKDYKRSVEQLRLITENCSPAHIIQNKKQHVTDINIKMDMLLGNKLKSAKQKLLIFTERLEGQSPLAKLTGGYSYVTDASGKNIRHVKDVRPGDHININVSDGVISAVTE
ncbi:MAG: exodeoxyribonuclease VII large subunit [Parasporobacterium sp.]|nr:exodeoxyribonuclease VII large subunit [Parasporobacterium sp.]